VDSFYLVVGERAPALEQLLARKDEALLVRGNALLVLYHALDHVDCAVGGPILCPTISVTVNFNQLLRDGLMPKCAAKQSGVAPTFSSW
jgi:hypothetical protein